MSVNLFSEACEIALSGWLSGAGRGEEIIFQLNKKILLYQNVENIFRFLVKQKKLSLGHVAPVWFGFHDVLSLHDQFVSAIDD